MKRLSVLSLVMVTALLAVIFSLGGTLGSNQALAAESPWPMFQHDAQHTGRSEYVGPQTLDVRWICDIITNSPENIGCYHQVIGTGGVIYLGVKLNDNEDNPIGRLYAVNPYGTIRWQIDLEGWPMTLAVGSDGTIYVGTYHHGTLYAINPDGTEKWRFYIEEPLYRGSEITIGPDRTIYFPTNSGLHALNPDGTEKWCYREKYLWGIIPVYHLMHFLAPVIGTDGTIYTVFPGNVGMVDYIGGIVHALNPDGILKWKKGLGVCSLSPPSVGPDGTIYVAGTYLYALDPSNGEIIWKEPITDHISGMAYYYTALTPVITSDGTIIAIVYSWYGTPYYVCRAYSLQGEILWTFEPWNLHPTNPIVDAEGTVFIPWRIHMSSGNLLTRIYCIDSKEGMVEQSYDVYASPNASPTIGATGDLYIPFLSDVGGHSLKLYAIGSTPLDIDEDGLPDWWELEYFGDTSPGPNDDNDTDGLTNLEEYNYGTDPTDADTDDDALNDGDEVKIYHTNPTKKDSDGDWFSDKEEIDSGTDPNNPCDFPFRTICLSQFRHYGTIPVGNGVNESTVFFKGLVPDPEGDQVKLQIELRRLDEYGGQFDETQGGLIESPYVESGSKAVAYAYELVVGDYHWRARIIDEHGNASDWVEFGDNDISETDFKIVPNQSPFASFTFSSQTPKVAEEIFLDASGSYDSDGWIVSYEWDLDGDGEYDHFTTKEKVFTSWYKSGSYTVKLRITDNLSDTKECTSDINVKRDSLWETVKKLFASSRDTLSKRETQRLEVIKSELGLTNMNINQGRWTDDQLWTILDTKIIDDPQADMTYEDYIMHTLHEMYLADFAAQTSYSAPPEVEIYQKMAELEVWLKSLESLTIMIVDAGLTAASCPICIGPILMIKDFFHYTEKFEEILSKIMENRAIWFYFLNRQLGDSPEVAIGLSPVSPDPEIREKTRDYFESLWIEYGGDHIADSGGLKEDFKEQVREDLRTFLYSALEKQFGQTIYTTYRPYSPVELLVYDSQGQATGLINGELREEIPTSAYDDESKTVLIFSSTDTYRCQIVGTDKGTYGLEVTSVDNGEATTFTATDIPTSSGAAHEYTIDWDALSQGGEGVNVQVDLDGDGTFEKGFTTDNDLTQEEYQAAIGEAVEGDLDGDGDVDRDDLNIILSHRNQPASVCPECDIDGDGTITVLDGRKLVLKCTRPRCACE